MSAGLELDRFLADLGAERDLMPAQSGRAYVLTDDRGVVLQELDTCGTWEDLLQRIVEATVRLAPGARHARLVGSGRHDEAELEPDAPTTGQGSVS